MIGEKDILINLTRRDDLPCESALGRDYLDRIKDKDGTVIGWGVIAPGAHAAGVQLNGGIPAQSLAVMLRKIATAIENNPEIAGQVIGSMGYFERGRGSSRQDGRRNPNNGGADLSAPRKSPSWFSRFHRTQIGSFKRDEIDARSWRARRVELDRPAL